MADSVNTQITEGDREHNPKAVFIGTTEAIINPLALYLDSHNVELFSGKTLTDAFFGDYFFYIGEFSHVKDFMEKQGTGLPKALLICPWVSDFADAEMMLEKYPQVKIAWLGSMETLTEKDVERIMELFFVEHRKVAYLRQAKPVSLKSLPSSEEASQPSDLSETEKELVLPHEQEIHASNIAREVEQKSQKDIPKPDEEKKIESEANISAFFTDQSASPLVVDKKLESFFENSDPKQTGKPKMDKKRLSLLPALLFSILFFLIFPIVFVSAEIGMSYIFLKKGFQDLVAARFTSSERFLSASRTLSSFASQNSIIVSPFFTLLDKENEFEGLRQVIEVQKQAAEAGLFVGSATEEGMVLFKAIGGREKGLAFGQTISGIKGNVTLADQALAQAQAQLKTTTVTEFAQFVPALENRLEDQKELLSHARSSLETLRLLLSFLPETIGLYGEKNLLSTFSK